MKRLRAVGLVVAGVLLVAGCSSGSGKPQPSQLVDNPGTGKFLGAGLDPAQPRPSFTLADEAGKPFSFATATTGHPTLLYFGYTSCPDVCPTTMYDVGAALRSLPASVQSETYVVFVSTDVKHDTGPVIKQWLSNFSNGTSARWIGLRGTQDEIDLAQTAAHVVVAADGGQTHSGSVLMYGADNYARITFLESTNEQQQIAHDLPLVANS